MAMIGFCVKRSAFGIPFWSYYIKIYTKYTSSTTKRLMDPKSRPTHCYFAKNTFLMISSFCAISKTDISYKAVKVSHYNHY